MKVNDTIVCIASGPSLTVDDLAAVRNCYTVAVNNSWNAAPWCDVVFAGDAAWWEHHGEEVLLTTKRKVTCSKTAADRYGIEYFKRQVSVGYNSGQVAIEWAISQRPSRIILLGYDCSLKYGKHWHADYKRKNPTNDVVKKWHNQFAKLDAADVDVVNCSRYTELGCFRRAKLEAVL